MNGPASRPASTPWSEGRAVATIMEMTFPRSIDSLPRVFEAVEDFLSGLSMSEEARFAITFSVEELFTNLVKYNSSVGRTSSWSS